MSSAYSDSSFSTLISSLRRWLLWYWIRDALANVGRTPQRRAIVPGQVVVMEPSRRTRASIPWYDLILEVANSRLLGNARARSTIDLATLPNESALLAGDPVGPTSDDVTRTTLRTTVLACRPGLEGVLARRLRRAVARASRYRPISHAALPYISEVPYISFSTQVGERVATTIKVHHSRREPQRGKWMPKVGIIDTDVDEQHLQSLGHNVALIWEGTVRDGGLNQPLEVSNQRSERKVGVHGTAVAVIAASHGTIEVHSVGCDSASAPDREPETADALLDVPGSFILQGLRMLRDCDIVNISMTIDRRVSDVAVHFEQMLEAYIDVLVDQGLVVVAAVGRQQLAAVLQRDGDYGYELITDAGAPARFSTVIGVGSTSPGDRNSGVVGPHTVLDVDWLCTVDGEPFGRSSAAAAELSGAMCWMILDRYENRPPRQELVPYSRMLASYIPQCHFI